MTAGLNRLHHDERGGILVLVALWLPVLLATLAFVVDVGNWQEHKRHLQLQADAAALAGGSSISLSACNNASVESETRAYAGSDSATPTALYNDQVGGTPTNKLHVLINSTDYWNDGGTDFSDGSHPCDAPVDGSGLHVDVKITEASNSKLQFFSPVLKLFGSGVLAPTINAHARVQIKQASSFAGNLPIGVVDISPRSGAVIFYDEDAGPSSAPIDVRYLNTTGCPALGGLAVWCDTVTNPASPTTTGPASVPIGTRTHIGAVVALSSDGPPLNAPMSISGTTVAEICNQARVGCYYTDSSTGAPVVQSGLLHVHGFDGSPPAAGATVAPAVQATQLAAATTCGDGMYVSFFYRDTTCVVQLTAKIVTARPTTDLQLAAFGGNCGNNGCPLSPVSTSGSVQTWQSLASGGNAIGITAHSGPGAPTTIGSNSITLGWVVKSGSIDPFGACGNNFNNSPCRGNWAGVQRAFSGSDEFSGPIRLAHLLNMDSATPASGPEYHDYARGTTHSLAIAIALAGQLAQSVNDPPVALRVTGSQNGSIDCDPAKTIRDQLATGCGPSYAINKDPALTCPAYNVLWTTPEPWKCVKTQTGGSIGNFVNGIQGRVLNGGSTCPTGFAPPYADPLNAPYVPGGNYWQWFGSKDFVATDPRVVQVFMVPAGSFQGSGNTIYPIVNAGVFYVTGWGGNGGGTDDPCRQLDGTAADFAPSGFLIGHFIKRSNSINNGGGTITCEISDFSPCVPVLTD